MTARALDEAGLMEMLDAAEQAVHDEPTVAFELTEACDAVATESGLLAVTARASYLRARVCAERGDFEEARRLIERARRSWADTGDQLAALRTNLGLMHVLDDLGRHHDAGKVGAELLDALDRYDAVPDETLLCGRMRATAWNNIGASRCLAGNHEGALDAYESAEAAYAASGLLDDCAQPLANRGIALVALGRPREALDVLDAASAVFARVGDRLWEAKCGGVVAQAHQQLGELMDALRVLDRARGTLEGLEAHAEIVRIRLASANVYLSAGLFAEARAEAIGAATGAECVSLRHDQAIATFVVALAHLGGGDLDDARVALRHAAIAFAALGDDQYAARVELASAQLASHEGRDAEAATQLAVAVTKLAAGGWRIPEAWARLRATDFASPDVARALLDEASCLVDELGLPDLRYAHKLRWARLHAAGDERDLAEACFRAAISDVDSLGANLSDPTLALSVRADKLEAHDGLIDLLVRRGQPADLVEALRIGDEAKAKTLLDMVTGTIGTRVRSVADDAPVLDALRERRTDLSAVYNAMVGATTAAQLARLRGDARRLEDDVARLRLQAGTSAGLRTTTTDILDEPCDVDDRCDATTVAYHVVGDDIIAFVVAGSDVRARTLIGARSSARSASQRLMAQWQRRRIASTVAPRGSSGLLASTRHDLELLHHLLLAPILDDVRDHDHTDIVIVPHRELHQVPFHALYDGERYALELWTMSLAPTVGRVRGLSGRHSAERRGALVLAVADDRAAAIATEARTIAARMPDSRVLSGSAATMDALRASLPGPAFVHLACHGLYSGANPMFSALRLGDRWITTGEILDLDLDLGGALVTLSACESGRPGRDTAEPVGLAWAFLAAGASGALVSQWIVDDDTTAELMAEIYVNLAAGRTPAESLRSAQLAVAERAPHPFHWAPFAHVTSPSTRLIGTSE